MKLKNLISLLISGSMLLSTVAYSAETLDYSIDLESKVIKYTYTNSDFGKTECAIAVTSDGSDIPVYAKHQKSDFGGIVKGEIHLLNKGDYTLSVKPMGSKDAFTQEFMIFDDDDRNNYWNILTKGTDPQAISDNWDKISTILSITKSDDTSILSLSKVLSQNRDRDFGERNDSNLRAFKSYLASEAELLAQLNVKKTRELLEDTFDYIKIEDEVFYNELIIIFPQRADDIVPLYAEAAGTVYTFAGVCALLKDCVDTVKASDILLKINSASHTSLIKNIISDVENARILGIADLLDEYGALTSTTKVDNALWNKGFKNKDEFVDAFKKALEEPVTDNREENTNVSKRPSSPGGGGAGIIATQGHPASDAELAFSDISDYGWAKSAIISLYDKKIINGRSEGVFAPGDNVTRAEFVKMLVHSLGIEPANLQSVFSDVAPDDWFAVYVSAAYEHGIANGSGEKFNPSAFITREDAAVMIARGLSLDASSELTFTDAELISDYARDAVSALVASGIINGMSDGSFAPKNNLTRAQAAVMLDRLIQIYIAEVN